MALLLVALFACSGPPEVPAVRPAREVPPPSPTDLVRLAMEAPDRLPADRELDAQRAPAEVLGFFGVAPGTTVLEIGAGGGYTTELIARVVGPDGTVYGQNAPFVLERFAEAPWSERLTRPVMANTVRVDAPFDAPVPEAAVGRLDLVVNVLFYHDTVWQEVDRAAMNAAVFAGLAPGGVYGIVDHSARPEDGLAVTKSLHRIDERVVRQEVEAAGFVLEASSDVLRSPDDARDWNAAPGASGERRGTSDRFVLRFRKPRP